MDWREVTIYTTTEGIGPVEALLEDNGVEGYVLEDAADFEEFLKDTEIYWDYVDEDLVREKRAQETCLKIYLPDSDEGAKQYADIRAALENLKARDEEHAWGRLCTETALTRQEDWEWGWKQYFKPFPVGRSFMIKPSWETVEDPQGRRILEIDPASSFGTGSHATTRMCLAALEKYCSPETTVLDLGCGSGILGIGSLVLGCRSCVGCDIDPKAPDVAMSNAALNGIGSDRFRVYAGDIIGDASLRRELGSEYQLVLANIVSDVIIPLSGYVRQFMAEGAVFICSGIIEGRQDEVSAVLQKNGFEIVTHYCEEEWHCFECR